MKERTGIAISNDSTYARGRLADKVPLSTPYAVDFAPVTYCNLKCIFCSYSSTNHVYDKILGKKLDFDFVKKAINDIKLFPEKLKAIHFCGLGEPLLHKDIAKMIKYAKDANVAEKVDMNTNGILLTEKMADQVIDSGLDFIRISLNGLSSDDYITYCDTKIDFPAYITNLRYFYEHRKNTKIYLKIFNFMVETAETKELFKKTFEPLCDVLSIENYNECFLDTKGKKLLADTNKNQRGEASTTAKCCSQPFFRLLIGADKEITPCCEPLFPFSMGNAEKDSVASIWNNNTWCNFRLQMLDGRLNANEVCSNCQTLKNNCYTADDIDSEIDRLKKYYTEQLSYKKDKNR
jgi:MoaA/NifB/PqqE/SkfB family radical SAM enzyme